MKVANWISEQCSTVGTGSIVLVGAPAGYANFYKGFKSGDVIYYSIRDGNNKEAGTGIFNGSNTITRVPQTTLYDGAFSSSAPSPIELSGTSIVACTVNAESYDELLSNPALQTHIADKTNPHDVDKEQVQLGNVVNKDFSYVDTHIANLDNPHQTTAEKTPFVPPASMSSTNTQDAIEEVNTLATFSSTDSYEHRSTSRFYGSISQLTDDSIILNECGVFIREPSQPPSTSNNAGYLVHEFELINLSSYMTESGPDYLDIGIGLEGRCPLCTTVSHVGKFTDIELRYYARIGRVTYNDKIITGIQLQGTQYDTAAETLKDVLNFVEPLKKGLSVFSASSTERKFYVESGKVFTQGANYINEYRSPNILQYNQVGGVTAPVNFRHIYEYQNEQNTSTLTNSVNASYNSNDGTITDLQAGEVTIHYLFMDHSQNFYVQYGQNLYTSFSIAQSMLDIDERITPFPDVYGNEMILLAQMIVSDGTGYFGDGSNAVYRTT